MEQLVRDCRIAQIYEGTNGIQALDLLGRKVLADQGQKLRQLSALVLAFCKQQQERADLQEFIAPLQQLIKSVGEITIKIGMAAQRDKDEVGAAATDYLRLIGHLTYGWLWARMAALALEHAGDDDFYRAKLATARFYFAKLFPETQALLAQLHSGARPVMSLGDDGFN